MNPAESAKDTKRLLPPGLAYLADNITTKQNVMGAGKASKSKWAKGLKFSDSAETIFFAGCGYQYDNELESLMALLRKIDRSSIGADAALNMANLQKKMGIDAGAIFNKLTGSDKGESRPLRDAVKILNRLGIEFGYLAEEEPCCGGPLYYFGLHRRFENHARDAYNTLKNDGVKRIISIVPSCTNTLRNAIPSVVGAKDIEVKHFSEVVAENIGHLSLRFPREIKVTYHDPCQLTRYMGLSEEPRRILQSIRGVELVEPAWTKKGFATCCGGGAGFEAVFPELSEILAVNRAKELAETGAQVIVTQCPGCIMQLKTGLKGLGNAGIEVMDLAEIVAMSMEN